MAASRLPSNLTARRSNGRSGSAPPTRLVLRPRVEAAREGVGTIHDSLFADAKEKRKVKTEPQVHRHFCPLRLFHSALLLLTNEALHYVRPCDR